tara:strand:- start:199 stop:357 length:159 start_codon:yes stop_codon:yes gene_type:complete
MKYNADWWFGENSIWGKLGVTQIGVVKFGNKVNYNNIALLVIGGAILIKLNK